MFELTEYEMDRKPQKIIMDNSISISPRSLQRELMCPICLDVLNQTMTTRECLHRFCSACINKALRSGNKECPTCRKKLTSRRCLRADPNFDQLISKIYTGEHDKQKEVVIAPECEIILRPLHGQGTRFIKCPLKTSVDHLVKYLSIRPDQSKAPNFNSKEEYKLCTVKNRARGHYEVLCGSSKLEEIKLDSNKPIELYFYEENHHEAQ